MDVDYTQVDNR